MDKQRPVKIMEYRNIILPIYFDEVGNQFYTVLDGEEIGFGSFNGEITSDIKYFVDRKLDLIFEFEDFPDTKIEWFENGFNHRDIRLVYNYRVIKIFLVHREEEITDVSINKIIEESRRVLKSILPMIC